jgi:pimeloyl-ACP methyl ester carboxylesterase
MTRPFVLVASLLIGMAGPAAAQVTPPAPGDAVFRIFRGGRPVGSETVMVTVTDAEIIVFSGNQGNPQGTGLRQAEFRYDRQWHPTSSKVERVADGLPVQLNTVFENGKATTQIIRNDVVTPRHADVSADTVLLPNNVWGAYEALAARLVNAEPGATVPVFVLPEAELTVTLDSVAKERVTTTSRAFETRHHRFTFHDFGSELKADLWTDDRGRLIRLIVPVLALDVARDDIATVSTRQQTMFRANDEDLFIPANGFNLASTVSRPLPLPPPVNGKPAKLPAIVLIGANETDRDEMAYGIPIFAQLADALANAGYLVVRYDKRGVGQSGGRPESATLTDYAEDAFAAVTYLRDKRKDVDEDRIVLLGYGDGASVAQIAGKRAGKKVKALVLIAGGGVTGQELILEQQQHLLDRLQLSPEERQSKIDAQKKVMNAALTGQGWDDIDTEVRRGADTESYRSVLRFDPAPIMKDVRQPILIIHGELDKQVLPAHADKLAALARARKNPPDVQVARLPGVNHLLMPSKTGEVDEYSSLETKTISAEVSAKTVEWLKSALTPKS